MICRFCDFVTNNLLPGWNTCEHKNTFWNPRNGTFTFFSLFVCTTSSSDNNMTHLIQFCTVIRWYTNFDIHWLSRSRNKPLWQLMSTVYWKQCDVHAKSSNDIFAIKSRLLRESVMQPMICLLVNFLLLAAYSRKSPNIWQANWKSGILTNSRKLPRNLLLTYLPNYLLPWILSCFLNYLTLIHRNIGISQQIFADIFNIVLTYCMFYELAKSCFYQNLIPF